MTRDQARAEIRRLGRADSTGPWRRIVQAEALGWAPSRDDQRQHDRYIGLVTALQIDYHL
jgi:hypothetical protein